MARPRIQQPWRTPSPSPSLAKLEADPKAFTRGDVLKVRRRVVLKTWRGVPYIAAWPRQRKHTQSEVQQAWVDAFKDRAQVLKAPDPRLYQTAVEMAAGTGWYYRDVLERAAFGKLYTDQQERRVTTPTVFRKNSTSVLLTQNVNTPLSSDTSVWDNNAFYDAAHPTRLNVKAPGLYIVQAQVRWDTTSGSNSTAHTLVVNGTDIIAAHNVPGSTQANLTYAVHTIWYFHAGDYVEALVQKNAAGNRVILQAFFMLAITPEALV